MTQEKQDKQQKLNQDYADFLVEYDAAMAQGTPIGGFIAWRHENNRDGIKIPQRADK
jgi:hypothetical protein